MFLRTYVQNKKSHVVNPIVNHPQVTMGATKHPQISVALFIIGLATELTEVPVQCFPSKKTPVILMFRSFIA